VTCVASGDGGLQRLSQHRLHLGYEVFGETPVEEVGSRQPAGPHQAHARPAPSGVPCPWCEERKRGISFTRRVGMALRPDHILKDSSAYTGRVAQIVASPGFTSSTWHARTELGHLVTDDEGRPRNEMS